jgi:hypothetical protein
MMTFDDISAVGPLLDADAVVRDLGNDREIYCEVAALFLEDLGTVRAALAAELPVGALLPVIHEAANSLGVIGALRGAQQVRATEQRLREGQAITLTEVRRVAAQALDDAEAALRSWLARPTEPT